MEAACRCLFCQKLPEITRPRKGKRGKCPLCKGELLESDGTSYRLTGELSPAGFPKWPVASLLILVGALVFLRGTLFGNNSSSRQPKEPFSVDVVITRTHSLPTEPIASVANEPRRKAAVSLPINVAPKPAPTDLFVLKARAKPALSPLAMRVKGSSATSEMLALAKCPVPSFSEKELQMVLLQVPEVGLDGKLADELRIAHASTEDLLSIVQRQKEKAKEPNPVDPHHFLAELRKKQPWLSELPVRQGKDCQLVPKSSKDFGMYSLSVRCAMQAPQIESLSNSSLPMNPDAFWYNLERISKSRPRSFTDTASAGSCDWHDPAALRALGQILAIAETPFRISLMEHLGKTPAKIASIDLAKAALFDLNKDVRQAALAVLKSRPRKDFVPVLLEGFRYPWGPAAHHAAVALAELNAKETIPDLVDLLDSPDPGMPVPAKSGKQFLVRELVRINHHANCLLCHVPSKSVFDPARGPVPVPGKPLPSIADYFERGQTFVRADVTYLRQDFSAKLYVKDHDAWPAEQRYDFLVRSRMLKKEEAQKYRAPANSEHKNAVRYALQALTGKDAGLSASSWRQALAMTKRQTNWRSPCWK